MKTTNRRIRRTQLADADALASCIDAAYARYAQSVPDLPPVSDGCAEEIAENQVWVAIESGEIIGGLFLVAQDWAVKLVNVAVHPDHGGKGLGRECLT